MPICGKSLSSDCQVSIKQPVAQCNEFIDIFNLTKTTGWSESYQVHVKPKNRARVQEKTLLCNLNYNCVKSS